MKTRVSALMDGELETHECDGTLRALRGDATLRDEWREFQLVGDALRGESGLDVDLTARVMSALDTEPVVLAPQPTSVSRSAWLRPALALAASLAGVAVVGWVAMAPAVSPLGDGIGPLARTSQSEPVARQARAKRIEPVAQVAEVTASTSISERLHEYLVAHQAHSPAGGLEAGTRYVRTVSAMGETR